MRRPVRLTPSPRAKVWGKTRLSPWFPDAPEPVGEIWFSHRDELPLLVKLLFTSAKLSVQVHPDDGEAGVAGKTEMWHILEAEPGAAIALGFREPVTREQLRLACESGEVERLLDWKPVRAGETYFTPAHTVHAIGAGIVLCEIQQNSDITYRLYDYGRPRELHLEEGLRVADLGVHPGASASDTADGRLVECRHFVTDLVQAPPGQNVAIEARACHLWICIDGQGTIGGQAFRAGEVWLAPDVSEVRSESGARFLRTYVP